MCWCLHPPIAPVYGLYWCRVLRSPWHAGGGGRDAHVDGEDVVADVRPTVEVELPGLRAGAQGCGH